MDYNTMDQLMQQNSSKLILSSTISIQLLGTFLAISPSGAKAWMVKNLSRKDFLFIMYCLRFMKTMDGFYVDQKATV